MKRRFALPVVIALSLEAVLLLGFNHPRVLSAQPPNPPAPHPDALPIEDPEPLVQPDESTPGGPEQARPALPSIPEPPVVQRREDFAEVATPVSIPNAVSLDRVPPGVDGPPGMPGLGGQILPAGMLDNAPRVTYQRAPSYPHQAALDQRRGEVIVEFSVDEAGHVYGPAVVHSSDPVFDEPTLRAVLQWRFEPGRRFGKAVRFRMRLPVEFLPDAN